jgi:hypothetical protein
VVDDVLHAGKDCELGHCGAAAAAPSSVVERVVGDREEGADAARARVVDRRAGVDRREGDLVLVRGDQRGGIDGQDVVGAV